MIHFRNRVTARMNFGLIKRILYIGVPNGLENSLFQLGKILLLSLVSTFGTSAIAANAVCGTIANFNILPGMAINLALLSVASYCIGAGDYEQTRIYTKKLMRLTSVCMIAVSVAMILLCRIMLLLLPVDAGDGSTGGTGHTLPCFYVHVCMGAVVHSAQYPAGGGRRGVDNVDSHCFHVDVSDSLCLYFQ